MLKILVYYLDQQGNQKDVKTNPKEIFKNVTNLFGVNELNGGKMTFL